QRYCGLRLISLNCTGEKSSRLEARVSVVKVVARRIGHPFEEILTVSSIFGHRPNLPNTRNTRRAESVVRLTVRPVAIRRIGKEDEISFLFAMKMSNFCATKCSGRMASSMISSISALREVRVVVPELARYMRVDQKVFQDAATSFSHTTQIAVLLESKQTN